MLAWCVCWQPRASPPRLAPFLKKSVFLCVPLAPGPLSPSHSRVTGIMSSEIRAMVLLTLPYPPLPILVTSIEDDDGRLGCDDTVTSTHTLIAKGLTESMARDDPSFNEERLQRQKRVFQEFLHAMAVEGFSTTDPDVLYGIYCRASMAHVCTYLPPNHPADFRIPPLSYITKGDRTHSRLAEYLASQSIFFEDQPPIPRKQYLEREPRDLFFDLRARLGHVMTEEERTRADQVAQLTEKN